MSSHKQEQRKATQYRQKISTPKLHPRRLARSIAKAMGAGPRTWRSAVASLPRTGTRNLHPKGQRKREA